jgi:hypothetical protein
MEKLLKILMGKLLKIWWKNYWNFDGKITEILMEKLLKFWGESKDSPSLQEQISQDVFLTEFSTVSGVFSLWLKFKKKPLKIGSKYKI